MPGSVLILTHWLDPTVDAVVTELDRRGVPVFRADAADFPQRLAVAAELDGIVWAGAIKSAHRELDLSSIGSIYYRRPTKFDFPQGMSDGERRWAGSEARLGFGGLLASLGPWLNHPHRIGLAEYKPVQLVTARQCGLRTPRTLVTNDPAAARNFVSEVGRSVYKPFGQQGVNDHTGYRQVFTTAVDVADVGDAALSHTMHLIQQQVPKAFEVRLTVVDGCCLAARIDAGSEAAQVDWRADYAALSYSVIDVPEQVRRAIVALLAALELRFGAIDFVVTPDGEWVFLEINPNGQWGWIEDATGLPITAAIADALSR